jgi:hypothetical protein
LFSNKIAHFPCCVFGASSHVDDVPSPTVTLASRRLLAALGTQPILTGSASVSIPRETPF